jgi:mono/diheme cytochrome c family protein
MALDDVPATAAAGSERAPGSVGARAGRRVRGAALVLAVASLVAASPQRADRTATAPASEGGPGRILYLTDCQGCHGLDGRGDGPAAASLRTPPADLTRLWQRYGTPLDRERLRAYVDGRGLLEVHGPREMPVWGDEFFEDAPPLAPNLVEGAKQPPDRHARRVPRDDPDRAALLGMLGGRRPAHLAAARVSQSLSAGAAGQRHLLRRG